MRLRQSFVVGQDADANYFLETVERDVIRGCMTESTIY
jgi:hypothetical protein